MSEKMLFLEEGPMQTKQSKVFPMWVKALIALTPALVFLLFFTIFPIFNTIFISFFENFSWQAGQGGVAIVSFFRQLYQYNNADRLAAEAELLGEIFTPPLQPKISFENYKLVLGQSDFYSALWNTTILTITSVPLTIIISLLIAVSLNSIKALRATYQTIFFLPYVTNSIALGLVFNTLFSHEPGGIVNQLIVALGGNPISWIHTGDALPGTIPNSKFFTGVAIITNTVWSGLAFKILVFMSGLASIDRQYYDAARIDGAKRGTIFRRITVPLLSPQILYITITSFIGAFKAYQSVIAVIGKGERDFGGVNRDDWITVVGFIYKYRTNYPAIASAGSVILLIIILLITLLQMQVSKKRVYY